MKFFFGFTSGCVFVIIWAGIAYSDPILPSNFEKNDELELILKEKLVLQKVPIANQTGSHRISVGLVDITDPSRPQYACVNCNQSNGAPQVYGIASMGKIAISATVLKLTEEGKTDLNKIVQVTPKKCGGQSSVTMFNAIECSLRSSDNVASGSLFIEAGYENIKNFLVQHDLFDPVTLRGLHIGGNAYGAAARTKHGYFPRYGGASYVATTEAMLKFYYLLDQDAFFQDETTKEYMLDVMGKDGRGGGDVRMRVGFRAVGLPTEASYGKSGCFKNELVGSSIVNDGGRKYIVVTLTDNKTGIQGSGTVCGKLTPAGKGKWIANSAIAAELTIREFH